jgi:hypothetical protein
LKIELSDCSGRHVLVGMFALAMFCLVIGVLAFFAGRGSLKQEVLVKMPPIPKTVVYSVNRNDDTPDVVVHPPEVNIHVPPVEVKPVPAPVVVPKEQPTSKRPVAKKKMSVEKDHTLCTDPKVQAEAPKFEKIDNDKYGVLLPRPKDAPKPKGESVPTDKGE